MRLYKMTNGDQIIQHKVFKNIVMTLKITTNGILMKRGYSTILSKVQASYYGEAGGC